MPSYILPQGATPLDHLSNSDIAQCLKKITVTLDGYGVFEQFDNSYQFTYEDKWKIYEMLTRFKAFGDGEPIPPTEALARFRRFLEHPKTFEIDRTNFDNFLVQLQALKLKVPSGNDLGLRFYVGTNNSNEYSIVIVPMHGPTPPTGAPRDRTKELEKTFFVNAGIPFFALAPTRSDANKISNSERECVEFIRNKDPFGKEVVYFSEKAFSTFVTGLMGNIALMRMTIGRVNNLSGNVTLVLMFIDGNGSVIESKGVFGGQTVTGVCFDQGDLIPPPPPKLVDSSFDGL